MVSMNFGAKRVQDLNLPAFDKEPKNCRLLQSFHSPSVWRSWIFHREALISVLKQWNFENYSYGLKQEKPTTDHPLRVRESIWPYD